MKKIILLFVLLSSLLCNAQSRIILTTGDTLHGVVSDGMDVDHKSIVTTKGENKTVLTSMIKSVDPDKDYKFTETAGGNLVNASKTYFAGIAIVIVGAIITIAIIIAIPATPIIGGIIGGIITVAGMPLKYLLGKKLRKQVKFSNRKTYNFTVARLRMFLPSGDLI